MLMEAARRAEAAAKEMLAYVNTGSASCAEMRDALAVCTAFMAAGSAFQAGAARIIAQAERHGDGGTQVLADAAGLPHHEARSQVNTARVIEAAPAVRDAVESGRVSQANAKRLAEAIEKTGAEAVESDSALLAKAASLRPEQFVRESRRWTADRQADGGESEYGRQRARRRLRVWDGDDGMVHLGASSTPSPASASPTGCGPRPAVFMTSTSNRPRAATMLSAAASTSAWPTHSKASPASPATTPRALAAAASPSLTSVWSLTSTTPPGSS